MSLLLAPTRVFSVRSDHPALAAALCDDSWEAAFHFDEEPGGISLRVIESADAPPWAAYRKGGVIINAWQAGEICAYAGVEVEAYLRLLAAAGAMQWAALAANPLLEPDDLVHERRDCCLFSSTDCFEGIALLLDKPRLCPGTRWFYGQLVQPEEWACLERAVARVSSRAR